MALPTTPNPWLPENWSVTAQGNYVRLYGLQVAQKAAQAAGTTVGAPAPQATPLAGKTFIISKRVIQGGKSGGYGWSGDGPPDDDELAAQNKA